MSEQEHPQQGHLQRYDEVADVTSRVGTDLSEGEKAVRIDFNPSKIDEVFKLKRMYANLIDVLIWKRNAVTSPEVKREISLSITELQSSCRWAVGAYTYPY